MPWLCPSCVGFLSAHRLERREDPANTRVDRRWTGVTPTDDAVRIDYEEYTRTRPCPLIIGAVRPRHRSLGMRVGQQGISEAGGAGEGAVAPELVEVRL